MGRRANLSFTSREEVKETHDYGSIYESKTDANGNNQAVDKRRRELDNRTKSFIHSSIHFKKMCFSGLMLDFSVVTPLL